MAIAVVVDAVRTAMGRRHGSLAGWHPVDLAAETLTALVDRNGLDPGLIDDVILGCVSQTGEQGLDVARNAALAAGFPESVPGTTVDRQCGSGQQAVHFAAQGVMAGAYDVVVAGGVESMTRVPMGTTVAEGPPSASRAGGPPSASRAGGPPSASRAGGSGMPFGPRVVERYRSAGGLIPQGLAAELVAERWGLERAELDAYSLESHRRAARAAAEGRFDREVVPVMVEGRAVLRGPKDGARRPGRQDGARRPGRPFTVDEGVRADLTLEELASLKPTYRAEGRVTAGNSAQVSDGAAAVLVASEEAARRLGLEARARFRSFSVVGVDPLAMLTGPIPATTAVLERANLVLDDVDRVEINEGFAPVVLAWAHEHKADLDRVNVDGGAIALGNPAGSAGARMLATLLWGLERTGGRFGLQVMSEGGGMANALVLERLA